MPNESCANCRAFNAIADTSGGFCRRKSPVPILVATIPGKLGRPVGVVNSYHPQMPADGWCAEHMPGEPAHGRLPSIEFTRLEIEPAEGNA
mgnify:CR=1 FL=1